MPDNDLTFGFDTSFFEKGINKITKGMEGLQTTTGNVAKGISKGLTSIALKFGAVFAGAKAVQGALKSMPEIGQAFGIAKDVFLKNLLFPLRKEVFPLLQKMMDWVRDSRGAFVKWGQALANVFRSVVSGVKTIISFIVSMSEKISGFTQRIFGDQIKSVSELFDLISFKLATVIAFVSILIGDMGNIFKGFFSGLGDIGGSLTGIVENLLNFLKIFTQANDQGDSFTNILSTLSTRFGEIVGFVVRMTDKFLDGFVPAVSQIATPLQNIFDAWIGIQDSIFEATSSLLDWPAIFESLGGIVGKGIQKTFEFIALVLEDIETSIASIKELGFLNTLTSQTGNLFDAIQGKFFGRETQVQDAIIRTDGSIIRPDPNDTLIATKNPVFASSPSTNDNSQRSITMSIAPTIIIERGTEEEGRNVAIGFTEQMRSVLNTEFERSGN